ncbi:putative transcriptional regulator [Bacillus sp. TS-2]|uniref:HTH cro/C1-type domain-containing protein n=2 Tax=Alkalihalobacillus trypoxylicola TaxID=519424 RepID=A0A161Q387_9BACI|nr:hypothetical protein AZF04_19890 [Alkalihalobacillus trypoxylicola]GAF65234.1 putative transcriptional regulator [Bacillus sp. TS-2]
MFPHRLKSLRKNSELTQEGLGKLIDVSKVSISGYENGNRSPDTETLKKLADTFNVSIDFLLGRTDNPDGVVNIHFDGGKGLHVEDEDEEAYLREQLAQYRKMKERMRKRLEEDRK